MRYKITSEYVLLKNQGVVKMWFINGMAFTFDDVDNPSMDLIDSCEMEYTMDDLYHISQYLILEQCHPILFEMSELCEGEVPY
tara:strand:- start:4079 stop:4327 length:249 start_codon:yes stop_codon:yes gene_type:complete